MIGYMKPVKNTFPKEDRSLYQSLYCGLCRCLKHDYGFTGMAALNYMAVNTLLLTGAMAPEPYSMMVKSCSVSPFYWRKMAGTWEESFRAAAAVTIAAAALEIEDNLHDAGKWYHRLLHSLLSPKARHMMRRYEPEFLDLKDAYDRFMDLENRARAGDPDVTFDMLMEASGIIIARAAVTIGVYAHCQQLKELCDIMDLWGRWTYLLDAADDHAEDLASGQFNPLSLPDRPEDIRAGLEELENRANAILDQAVIRNYASAVHSLFRIQLPRRRELVLSKINMTEIEGNCNESSVPSENRSDSGHGADSAQ